MQIFIPGWKYWFADVSAPVPGSVDGGAHRVAAGGELLPNALCVYAGGGDMYIVVVV